jgi:hypothetical protein
LRLSDECIRRDIPNEAILAPLIPRNTSAMTSASRPEIGFIDKEPIVGSMVCDARARCEDENARGRIGIEKRLARSGTVSPWSSIPAELNIRVRPDLGQFVFALRDNICNVRDIV